MKKYKFNVIKWNLEKHNISPLFYQKFQILLLMENANTHLVSLFKDYLLYDDMTEFFKEYYKKPEIYERLKTIYEYYESSSYLFPNYTAINEGKYIYKNIIKKQNLIDYLEDLEDKKKEKEEKRAKKNKNLNSYNNEQSSSCFDVFDTKIYNNIIKETGNDSKINELFCVGVNNNNEECGDSFASILKLAEEIKENKQKIKYKNKINKINTEIKEVKKVKKEKYKIKKDNKDYNNKNESHINLNNINNKIKNRIESKIYVSRKIYTNLNQNNSNSKKLFKKAKIHLNINALLNNNFSNYNSKNFNHNNNNNKNHILNIDKCKSNDYLKNNQSIPSYRNINKNNYKKNNIIINIINNNKTNNYHSNINYFSNFTSINQNDNIKSDNKNYIIITDNNTNNSNTTKYNNNINNNTNNSNTTKYNSNINNKKKVNTNNYKNKINNSIKDKNELKSVIIEYSQNHSKKIAKKINKDTKSKILSFRLTTDTNLTDRIKSGKSQSILNKTGKEHSKNKSLISPRNNMKKRTKTEFLGTKTDIFLFGQQNEINPYKYNKSINRQILKNINLTNGHKPHKDISLINKKIINYHFGINSSRIEKKYIKHITTNSQNLTGVQIINKVSPLQLKEIAKKQTTVFSFNNTERTSRNQSKEQINKHHTMIKRNHLDSFSPKNTHEIIYKKMKKIHNKKSAIIHSFLKNAASSSKIKGLILSKKNNNSSNNYKGIINSKEIFNRTSKDKNF